MKLYTQPASFRAQKIIIAAQYAGKKVDVITDAPAAVIKVKSPIAKLPLLETEEGCIAESNAIARYIINSNSTGPLAGKSLLESAQVDSWVDFCSNEIEVPASVWVYPIIGWMGYHAEACKKAEKDLKTGMSVLENHLKSRTFIVGESITFADVALACALLLPFKIVLDQKARKQFSCVTRWFLTCVNQKEFAQVVGEVTLCKKALKAKAGGAAAPAKENKKAAKKENKKEAKKDAKPAPAPAPKKKKNPLDELPKSSMSLDAWKKKYTNAPGGDCYKAMPWFWENWDREGYSLFDGRYQYNDELKVGFMAANLAGGFIQRSDAVRKYSFGVIQLIGKEGGPMELRSIWLMRGDSIQPLLDANDDAEHYKWTKIPSNPDDAQKKYIEDMFCAWETIEGQAVVDGKVFK